MDKSRIKNSIAIISILFNSDELLEDFFYSLSQQVEVFFTLFLLDNNANLATETLINALGLKYKLTNSIIYIPSKTNIGFAEGNNKVLNKAMAMGFEFFLLSNNDIYFDNPTLLSSLKEKCQECKIITPKILYANSDKIWYSGGYIDKSRGINIHQFEFQSEAKVCQLERKVEFAPACFLMLRREVLEKVGLFDEKFFVYWEDVDFCVRAIENGFDITLMPDLKIYHKVSISTGGRASLFSTYYFLRNRLYFINKHFSKWHALCSLVYTYSTSLIKILFYDFPRKKILLKAIIDFHKM